MDNNIRINQNEFPGFNNILQKLSHHLKEDHTSKALSIQLDRAKSVMDQERRTFIKRSLMLNIVKEQAYKTKDEKG